MQSRLYRILIGSLVVVAALGMTGCGSKKQTADKPPVAEMGNTITKG